MLQLIRGTTRLPVTTWAQSDVLLRFGKNPPPAAYMADEYEAALEAGKAGMEAFAKDRTR